MANPANIFSTSGVGNKYVEGDSMIFLKNKETDLFVTTNAKNKNVLEIDSGYQYATSMSPYRMEVNSLKVIKVNSSELSEINF